MEKKRDDGKLFREEKNWPPAVSKLFYADDFIIMSNLRCSFFFTAEWVFNEISKPCPGFTQWSPATVKPVLVAQIATSVFSVHLLSSFASIQTESRGTSRSEMSWGSVHPISIYIGPCASKGGKKTLQHLLFPSRQRLLCFDRWCFQRLSVFLSITNSGRQGEKREGE